MINHSRENNQQPGSGTAANIPPKKSFTLSATAKPFSFNVFAPAFVPGTGTTPVMALNLPIDDDLKTRIPVSKHKGRSSKSVEVRVHDLQAIKNCSSCEQALKLLHEMGSSASNSA